MDYYYCLNGLLLLSIVMMACDEHIQLANFIKAVHRNLREETRKFGAEVAWRKHCENATDLNKYASAMKQLATKHWEASYKNEESKTFSRIAWVYDSCKDYFDVKLFVQRRKEEEIANKLNLHTSVQICGSVDKIQLLDVGSCYNPFCTFTDFNVTAIDIAPASNDVYTCDFLQVNIGNKMQVTDTTIKVLPKNTFHVIVFSLVLEYLPTAEQRILFCENAYKLLITEGILVIITPDSKHANANTKFVKTWRYLLAQLGFSRITVEKLRHINCMLFRKCLRQEIAQRWAEMHNSYKEYDSLVIPQDFSTLCACAKPKLVYNDDDTTNSINLLFLEELPYFDLS